MTEDERQPTRQERRDERQEKERTFRTDNRRSVRLQVMLAGKQKPKRRRR